jgi:glucan phosphorylase
MPSSIYLILKYLKVKHEKLNNSHLLNCAYLALTLSNSIIGVAESKHELLAAKGILA